MSGWEDFIGLKGLPWWLACISHYQLLTTHYDHNDHHDHLRYQVLCYTVYSPFVDSFGIPCSPNLGAKEKRLKSYPFADARISLYQQRA